MKRLLLAILAIVPVILTCGCSSGTPSATPVDSSGYHGTFSVYTNPVLRYKIDYPTGWNVSESTGSSNLSSDVFGVTISGREHNETVEVMVTDSGGAGLINWVNQYVSVINLRYPGRPVMFQAINVSGNYAYAINHESMLDGQEFKNSDLIIARGPNIYLAGYATDKSAFDSALAERVLNSFAFV